MKKRITRVCRSAFFCLLALPWSAHAQATEPPPVVAPFQQLDTLCVNDWWNREPSEIIDLRVPRDQVVAFGIYTVANQTLKLSAQLFPLYPRETRTVRMEIKTGDRWKQIAQQQVIDIGWSALFRVENWDNSNDVAYRLRHGERAMFEGLIRKNPVDKPEIVVAALSCNSNKDRGGRENYIRNINHQDPDLIFFVGDQSYDHRQHTAAWLKFGKQFRELFRSRACVTIPDDHDIGQGNVWGEGGKKATRQAGNDGGYFFHPEYVKMVERCQTAHLPDPFDPTPIVQGIGVYYTRLAVGGVDYSNGWPQSGRNKALRLIREANAVHIAGDQHLATVIQHGIDEYRDGPWAFVVPAIVNNYYSRWWWPEDEQPGGNHDPHNPLPWTGDYLDGSDNRITMHAYANPDSPSFGSGYGLVRFNKSSRTVTFECWPRDVDVSQPGAEQFAGWPVTVRLEKIPADRDQ